MTTKLDEEILFSLLCKTFDRGDRCELIMSVTRNILVVLVFYYIILTCALASIVEVLRFIILLKIELILDETTSKSLPGLFFSRTSKTEKF